MSFNPNQPVLEDAEWALVAELLEEERRELPKEIRHTYSRAYREQLRHRLQLIEALLARLRSVTVTAE